MLGAECFLTQLEAHDGLQIILKTKATLFAAPMNDSDHAWIELLVKK